MKLLILAFFLFSIVTRLARKAIVASGMESIMVVANKSGQNRRVKLGLVGLGAFGYLHAVTIASLAEAELNAVVDSDVERLKRASADFSETPQWEDVETALLEADVEAWIVASSTNTHVPIAERLLVAGKPVLLEKPLASSMVQAERLAPLIPGDSRNFMMGHLLLFSSEVIQLRKELANRQRIDYIECVRHRPAKTVETYPGESPLYLTMVHDLYLVQVLKGCEEPEQVSAQIHHAQDGACDLVLAQLQWADGSLASLTASFMTPEGLGREGFDRMELFGPGWAARISANPRPLEFWDDRSRYPMHLDICAGQDISTGMLAEELRVFCQVVRGHRSVPQGATYQDAVQLQRWLKRMEEKVT